MLKVYKFFIGYYLFCSEPATAEQEENKGNLDYGIGSESTGPCLTTSDDC